MKNKQTNKQKGKRASVTNELAIIVLILSAFLLGSFILAWVFLSHLI